MAHVQIKYQGKPVIEGNFEDMAGATDMAILAIKAAHPEVDVENLDITAAMIDLAPGQPENCEACTSAGEHQEG